METGGVKIVEGRKKITAKARLLPNKCIACGQCEQTCPVNAITYDQKGEPLIDLGKCIGCRKCVKVCPAEALEMVHLLSEPGSAGKAMPQADGSSAPPLEAAGKPWKGVWTLVEHLDGKPHPVSWELLGAGRRLAEDLGVELAALLLGENVEHLTELAFAYGADKVYLMDDPIFRLYRTEPYLEGVAHLVSTYHPEILLIGATGLGRDLSGAVATKLSTGLTADCTALSIDKETGLLEQTRPAYGGNILATILTEHSRPQMASVRPKVMAVPPAKEGRTGEIIRGSIPLKEKEIAARILEITAIQCETDIDITASSVVVSGGKGMEDEKGFAMLQELASLLGGVVAASRSAVDAGWMPYERQVGQTGRTVRPRLYIACGISGAIQHIVGMQDSEHIIAINRDQKAPIFELAHLGIVGDVFEIVPLLIEALRTRVKPAVCEA